MEYKYKIYENVYNAIMSGEKTIEFRLLNAKSESIKRGDTIKFEIFNDESKYVFVKVLGKYIYTNIDELWNDRDVKSNFLDYTKEEFIKIFNEIFGEENVKKSKIVGIKFEGVMI